MKGKRGENNMIIVVPMVLVILLLIWGVATYNRLITGRLEIQAQWSQTDVVPRQRFDLIPNLVEAIKGYVAHEKEALQTVTDARSRHLSVEDAQGQMKVSTELSSAMSRLMVVTEYYPKLKTNQNFLHLQQQISVMGGEPTNYRQPYNDAVLCYNSLLVAIPIDLIAGLLHFQKKGFLKAEEAEKAVVTVKF